MNYGVRIGLILLLVTAVLSLLILASGLSRVPMSVAWTNYLPSGSASDLELDQDNPSLFAFVPRIPSSVLEALSLVLLIIFPLALLVTLLSREMRRRLLKDLKTAVVYLVLVAALLIFGRRLSELFVQQSFSGGDVGELAVPDFVSSPPALLVFLFAILLLVAMAAAGWIFWQRNRRARRVELIAIGAEKTLADLQSGADFHNAIVAYYFNMCEILCRQQRVKRADSKTPSEFARRLEQIGLGGPEVRRLTSLFEKVRYGGKSFSEADKESAVECLTTISLISRRSSLVDGPVREIRKTADVH